MSKAKGTRYERELATTLDALGYGTIRIPSSGSATDRNLPDVLAGEPDQSRPGRRASRCMAIECKAGQATTLYVEESEVADLRAFADAFGAEAFLAARYTTQATDTGHYLVRPGDARRTDSGTYGLPVSDIDDRAARVFYPTDGDGDE